MKTTARTVGILILVCLIGGCAGFAGHHDKLVTYNLVKDGRFDNTNLLVDPLEDFSQAGKSYVYLLTKTKFAVDNKYATIFNGESAYEQKQISSGFVVNLPTGFPAGKYIMTDDHVVSQYRLVAQINTPYGVMDIKLDKVVGEKTYLMYKNKEIELTDYEIFNDRSNDLALYRLPKNVDIPAFPHPFGNSDKLRVHNFVYMMGRPRNLTEMNARAGCITALAGPFYCDELSKRGNLYKIPLKDLPQNYFMLDASLNHGDSGLPVVAILDGKLEVVGLGHAVIPNMPGMGIAQRINHLMDVIKKYLKKTPEKFF